ncbi:MAG: sodium:solute symporter family transporter [Pseudomonadales bacterium]
MSNLLLTALLVVWFSPVWSSDAITGEVDKQPLNITAITMFLLFVLATLGITVWSARRSRSPDQLYTAAGGITAWQNGVAISGDFLSAASFLGITSALYFYGIDGLLLIIGVMGSWPVILFLIAERLRNLGKYTLVDVVSFRLAQRPVRLLAAFSSLTVVIFYLIAQLVGAGKLIQLLFGLDYVYAVVTVSILMMVYVSLGGMLATTWVQFIKAILLIIGGSAMAFLILLHFQFDVGRLFTSAVETHPSGNNLLAPGGWLKEPMSVISLGLTSLFGFIGLPHILMRMFTVKDARAARKSSFYAIGIMAYFYLLIMLIGFGAVTVLLNNPAYHDADGNMLGGANMVAVHLSHFLGGDLLLGFMAAVTFATILAVVAGLTLAGAANIAHDLYGTFGKKGHSERAELIVMRLSVLGLGGISILLGVAFQYQNVAFVATLALAVSGSVNAPILIAAMYWRGLTTRGVVWGGIIGLLASVGLIILGPSVMVEALGYSEPIFPYVYPTVVSLPITVIGLWFFSVTENSPRAAAERQSFDEQFVRSELGIDIEGASAH